MNNCPDCGSSRNTPAAAGAKLICLDCLYSWYVVSGAGKRKIYARRALERASRDNTINYTDYLQQQNAKLKEENDKLRKQLGLVSPRVGVEMPL